MLTRIYRTLAILLLLLCASLSNAAEPKTAIRRYPVPLDGVLELEVPAAWQEELGTTKTGAFDVTITFRPATGDDFCVMVTAAPVTDPKKAAPGEVKSMVEEVMLANDRAIAEETDVVLQEIKGAMGSGYFYFVTDKNLKAGERKYRDYRYVRRGLLLAKDVGLFFSVMTHDKELADGTAAMNMLKTARITAAVPRDVSSTRPPGAENRAPRRYEVPFDGVIGLTVPTSWREYVVREQPPSFFSLFVDIAFLPPTGDDFMLQVTVSAPKGALPVDARRKLAQDFAIALARGKAEETSIEPRGLRLSTGIATYIDFTDKEIKEGERWPGKFRHVRDAHLAMDGLLVQATLRTHDKDSPVRDELLEILQSARKVPIQAD